MGGRVNVALPAHARDGSEGRAPRCSPRGLLDRRIARSGRVNRHRAGDARGARLAPCDARRRMAGARRMACPARTTGERRNGSFHAVDGRPPSSGDVLLRTPGRGESSVARSMDESPWMLANRARRAAEFGCASSPGAGRARVRRVSPGNVGRGNARAPAAARAGGDRGRWDCGGRAVGVEGFGCAGAHDLEDAVHRFAPDGDVERFSGVGSTRGVGSGRDCGAAMGHLGALARGAPPRSRDQASMALRLWGRAFPLRARMRLS